MGQENTKEPRSSRGIGGLESRFLSVQDPCREVQKLVRKLIVAGGILLFLAAAGVVSLSLLARKYVSVDAVILMAEEEINSRLHVGGAKLSVFRFGQPCANAFAEASVMSAARGSSTTSS